MGKYIIALDQGTTSSRAILFDEQQNIIAEQMIPLTQIYPMPGYVEHDPEEMFNIQYRAMVDVIKKARISLRDIAAIGVANQRETTIVWDKHTGKPVYNAIVWQCRRTADMCEKLRAYGLAPHIRETTGLVIDAYFSATKLAWILDNLPGARKQAEKGALLFGTVESWLIWKLSRGKVHITDYTNASRTMLFNIHTLDWDDTLLKALDIPRAMLPSPVPCSKVYTEIDLDGTYIPLAAAVGDQQGALFGQACFDEGEMKNTYGTGCFLLINSGTVPPPPNSGGLITLSAQSEKGTPAFVLEGSVFMGGAVMQWLRDELGILDTVEQSAEIAKSVQDNGGAYIVPAFTGLGAPHWDMYARGMICGLTRGVNSAHIVRAALEAIAYQSYDLVHCLFDKNVQIKQLKADGGASSNPFLMQFQADILGCPVVRPQIIETTALGAAYLAGLAVGVWDNTDQIKGLRKKEQVFNPCLDKAHRTQLLTHWHRAVQRSKGWQTTQK